ncbi:amino acid racemase [Caballeronia sp. dw_276]|uniref:aspartate/glutamate racemase family protein n=1 Tax=Caballeronia sp. dw_276 TaxID=2719795 RepID=UPI001BD4B879|nr:amino acid racemase [Caballeronia sp. dw_276]
MTYANSLARERLGLLGGMGSEAAAHFLRVLAQRTPARTDQDHLPFLMLSCPDIADRSAAILALDLSVRDEILRNLTALERAGCAALAIPCNTAHYWRAYFAAHLTVPFIDIVEATTAQIVKRRDRSVVILGTRATIEGRLYADPLLKHGVDVLQPEPGVVAQIEEMIALVKAGDRDPATRGLQRVLQVLQKRGLDAIVLACTELSMIAPSPTHRSIVDPDVCLADACVTWWHAHCAQATI